jgi:hypothetical protein
MRGLPRKSEEPFTVQNVVKVRPKVSLPLSVFLPKIRQKRQPKQEGRKQRQKMQYRSPTKVPTMVDIYEAVLVCFMSSLFMKNDHNIKSMSSPKRSWGQWSELMWTKICLLFESLKQPSLAQITTICMQGQAPSYFGRRWSLITCLCQINWWWHGMQLLKQELYGKSKSVN